MNKRYIKIALALLNIAGYIQNVAFGIGSSANGAKNSNSLRQKTVYQEYKDKECKDMYETFAAIDHAKEALPLLLKLAENTNSYSVNSTENENKTIYSKKIGNIDIGRLHLTIPLPLSLKFINGNGARLYSKYLILFEKLNIDGNHVNSQKRYALGAGIKQTNDTFVIVCPTRTLNYIGEINHETDLKEIIKNTKSIETGIDPEEALTKLADNIAEFVIKRTEDDKIHVTYINAIYDNGNSTEYAHNKRQRDHEYTKILKLSERIISNEFDYPPRKGV
ncbi:fam-a protein [Plasmodium vinckei vinckei]|uniref:Fam-a protein n=1 Tax=Plasmodium vinckei vinckei TaxID=54757 RepID=A0A449BMA0_PLAVN|nr:fam-a protein [Plasmodium vinckei vinckei]VEV54553.1 fam-a protein [Plasmodium vinckei vinckei]